MTQPEKNQKRKAQFSKETVVRLLKYITGTYKLRFVLVLVFILVSAAASVAGSLFLQILIDDYIGPLLGVQNPVFTGLLWAICAMGLIYLCGVLANWVYQRQMAIIGQGVQKRIRDEMFEKMQALPIRYFDQNSTGDIMSRYTNDIDTLRQMISQSIPMMFSSLVTMTLVFCAMLYTSWPLTVLVLLAVFAMLRITGKVAGKSGKYFIKQQKDLGAVNGYIEEMMNGQKVVKVFCYEDESSRRFDEKNEELFESADTANKYANIMMPIMNNLSSLTYVLVAIAGGALALGGVGGLTLGAIVSFLQLTKSFSQPIGQMSQQVNSIIMALAGAQRIFAMMDEEPEQDEGYVSLVNARYDHDGNLVEADERTGTWAWKHPHADGGLTYTKVEGNIEFAGVDFSYDGEKTVLYDVSLFAKPGQKIAFVGATGAGKTTITN
ncbi:ABC transporter ATP-binding protein, partial [Clostridia bacterium OttesenSCG-928-O13]|nr:ABC transporter ATP-binding protein [Clostridia bacterium OttesenSCG-928-O13]